MNCLDTDSEFYNNYVIPLDKAIKTKKIGLIMRWRQKHYAAARATAHGLSKEKYLRIYFKSLERTLFECKDDMHTISSARYRHYSLNNRASREHAMSEKIIILQDIIDNINKINIMGYAKQSFYSGANLEIFQKRLAKANVALKKQKENHIMQKYIAEKVNKFFSSHTRDLHYSKITLKDKHIMVKQWVGKMPCMRDEREKEEVDGIIKECCTGIFTNINSVKHLPVVLTAEFAKINKIISIRYRYESFHNYSDLVSFIKSKHALSILKEGFSQQRKTNRNISYLRVAIMLQKALKYSNKPTAGTGTGTEAYRTLILPRFYSYIVHLLQLFAQKILLKTRYNYTTMTDIMHAFPESISANISSFISNPLLPKEINVILYY